MRLIDFSSFHASMFACTHRWWHWLRSFLYALYITFLLLPMLQGQLYLLLIMMCSPLLVHPLCCCVYQPQSDGIVECFNQTLLDILAIHVEEHPSDWEDHFCKVCFAYMYNTSIHSTTGYTPFVWPSSEAYYHLEKLQALSASRSSGEPSGQSSCRESSNTIRDQNSSGAEPLAVG